MTSPREQEEQRRLQARWTAEALLADGALAEQVARRVLEDLRRHPPVARVAWSVEDAAERLGIGPTKMRELVAAGRVRSVKLDGRRLVPDDALDAFIADLAREAAS